MADDQVAASIDLLKGVLGRDLLGVYLYGSSVVGGLQRYSDVDLFVVSRRPTTRDDKARLASRMLTISNIDSADSRRPIELTIVVQSHISPWRYPPRFDFQYGDWMREAFASGEVRPWSTDVRPDLALLITQVLLASKTLYGHAAHELLDPVPYGDFITAIVAELDGLMADLGPDTRNVLLTFARIWSTVETDAIRSKPDAAAWVIDRLPAEYRPVMQRARAACLGEEPDRWGDTRELGQACADYMLTRINAQAALLSSSTNDDRSISLAD
jgi:streptomycin 3"-adenylyltransferase